MPKNRPQSTQQHSRPRASNNLPADHYQGRASFPNPPPSKEVRQQIRDNTLASIPDIHRYFDKPLEAASVFYDSQLPCLDPAQSPNLSYDKVTIEFGDTFVLKHRAGTTQEDALCYSSTLLPTLEKWKHLYPWRSHCVSREDGNEAECVGIFSPAVYMFKDELSKSCKELERKDTVLVSVISVAAIACPPTVVTNEGKTVIKSPKDKLKLLERIRMLLRMAAHNGKTVLILSAMGCGVWGCPPREVAELMKCVLAEAEFEGWFEEVSFRIYDKGACEVFREAFGDVRETTDEKGKEHSG